MVKGLPLTDAANAAVETVPMRPDIDSCKRLEEGCCGFTNPPSRKGNWMSPST
jgi:hypothetical protein